MTTYTLFGTDLRTIESALDLAAHLDKHAPNGFTRELVMGPYTVDVIDKDGDTELFVHNGTEWFSVNFDSALWTPLIRDHAPYTLPGYGHREFQSKADLIQYLDGQLTVPTTPTYDNAQDSDMASFEGGGVRSSDDGKPQFTHLMVTHMPYVEQPITRAAQRMAEGAERYGARNYEQFQDREAMERCYASLMRHVNQLGEEVFQGSRVDNEDHLAAVIANAVMLGSVMHRVYGE